MSETHTRGAAAEGRAEYSFQAEVNQVLDIVVHSLYSHREVFLRELISNASDALDKLRFRATSEPELFGTQPELEIVILPDQEQATLTIVDSGIGMSRDELIENLGTIARSGSKRFKEALKEKGQSGSVDLIGQFGVGFYSAFLVAKRVEVTSRAAGSSETWRWVSEADGKFTIEPVADRDRRGSEVKLHLNGESVEFLEEHRLRDLVRRYSDFVGHPIKLRVRKDKKSADFEFEQINKASALWKRPRTEITDEQYDEFYKHLTHDWENPIARNHFTIEGAQLFTGLVFVPKRAPFDLYDPEQRRGVRLYVKRVFIMDECEAMLPPWLRFLRGVVDSDDLPLNVSRETLQEDRIARTIKKNLVKKALDMFEELAEKRPDDYRSFWAEFGTVLKEGLHFDAESKDRLAKLARWRSTKSEFASLAEYVARMPENQKAIYYVLGLSQKAVEGGPHVESLVKRGFEVLYMTDAVDEWALKNLEEFEGKKLVSAMSEDLDVAGDDADAKKDLEDKKTAFEKLVERAKTVLDEQVSDVRVSSRLTDSPCCLVVPEGGHHVHMEQMLKLRMKDMAGPRRILEINPTHPIIERLRRLEEEKPASDDVADTIRLLYDQALLAEGRAVDDPQATARRMAALLGKAMGA